MVKIYVRCVDTLERSRCGVYSIYEDGKNVLSHSHDYSSYYLPTDAVYLSITASLRAALELGYKDVEVYVYNKPVVDGIINPNKASAQHQNYLHEMQGLIKQFDTINFIHAVPNPK